MATPLLFSVPWARGRYDVYTLTRRRRTRLKMRTRMRTRTADTAAITFYNLLGGAIARLFDVAEPASPKQGNSGLKLLEAVSNQMKLR